ncbi:LysM peptidoglycan-binding domain-containing protein [Arthrobacter sp. ok362]|uniref:LysM peptidoglycan-binding domain-containing protein n=1 Tax=Arthrobacter sp. ok362 TaxID=1761745 RepID=UPI00088FEF30|nr:LysM peptidoglycan-binding domain-containing protein [Arthrobacter sp. ok362]SDK68337.1 LysM domain-containing protein [Arthrobacter sp. ok362]
MSHGSGVKRVRPAAAVVLAVVLAGLLAACASGADAPGGTPAAAAHGTSPTAAATSPAPPGLLGTTEINGFFQPMRYTAVDGDTWEGIAAHFRMTPEILRSFNESASVAAGKVIDLRGVDVPQLGAGGSVTGQDGRGQLLYRTRAGDTPAGIASRYGVPLHALRIANLNYLTGGEWIPPAGTTVAIPNPPLD